MLLQAILLGLVQGLTEFLPISSSAHLVLVPWFLGWDPPSLAFDVALHLGTLAAVLVYLRRDWVRLLIAFLQGVRCRRFAGHPDRILAWFVIVGTVPATVIGFAAASYVERVTENPPIVAVELMVTGLILLAIPYGRGNRHSEQMTALDALAIGFAQAAAILPGISRSGTTIGMGLFRGLAPPEAARFSFLLAIPAIMGAGILEVPKLAAGHAGEMNAVAIVTGVSVAAVSGFLSIHYLLKLLATRNLKPFAVYCFAVGILALALAAVR